MAVTKAAVARSRKRALEAYRVRHKMPKEPGFDTTTGKFGDPAKHLLERVRVHAGLPRLGGYDRALKKILHNDGKTVGERAVAHLEAWSIAGWDENPPGSNHVPELAAVARRAGLSDWYQRMGWPWCMFAAGLAAYLEDSKTFTEAFHGKWNGLWTVAMLNAARAGDFGMRLLSASEPWPRGTYVLINFAGGDVVDHVFVLRSRVLFGLALVADLSTAEGNTSGQGQSGSQSNGGRMALRVRRVNKRDVYGIAIT